MRLLSIPADFMALDEVRHLGRVLAEGGSEFGKAVAPLFALRLWLDWARGGRPHRPYRSAVAKDGPGATDPLIYLIADATGWPNLSKILSMPASPESDAVRFALKAGVLTEETVAGAPGLTLTGFAECNAHLHPEYTSMQRKGPIVKAQIKALRDALSDGAKARQLLAQAGFEFPSAEKPTDAEMEAALGLILQFYVALDLSTVNPETGKSVTSEWSAALIADAVHLVRTHSPERLITVALWVRQNPGELPGTDPQFIVQNFASIASRVPDLKF